MARNKINNNKKINEEINEAIEDDDEEEEEIETTKTNQGKPKRSMSLKSVPISMKKYRKVIDSLREQLEDEEVTLSANDKFDLRLIKMYAEWMKDTVSDMLAEV